MLDLETLRDHFTDLGEEPALNGPGPGSFRFVDDRGGVAEPLRVWYYRPARYSEGRPILFVMHGVKRNAAEYRDNWAFAAERYGFLLLCPEFSADHYPRKAYQLGGLVDAPDGWLPEEARTFGVIERIFDFVKEKTRNATGRYYLYGHSAGGQFVHRLVLFMPRARFEKAVAANTGWYTMPVFGGKKFPYSLRHSGISETKLEEAFGRQLVVLLGGQDTNTDDPTLRKSRAARKQGAHRLERGHAFYATAKSEAARLGAELNWTLHTIPGAAHHDPHMMPTAARMLFHGDRRSRVLLVPTFVVMPGPACAIF